MTGSRLNSAQRRADDHRLFAPVPLPPLGEPTATANCQCCDVPVFLIMGELPDGWTEVADSSAPSGRSAVCPDCSAIALEVDQREPSEAFLPGCTRANVRRPTHLLYGGCWIYHWLVGKNAVLRMHGGEQARPAGRDEPIHFLATPEALDQMIIHLSNIRASLTPPSKAGRS